MIRIRHIDTCLPDYLQDLHARENEALLGVCLTGKWGRHNDDDERAATEQLCVELYEALPVGLVVSMPELEAAARRAVKGIDFRPFSPDGSRVCGEDLRACCKGCSWSDAVEACESRAWFVATWEEGEE